MRTVLDMSLAAGQSANLKAGEYEVRKGKVADHTRFRCEVTVANAGAAPKVLSAAQKLAILSAITLEFFKYGHGEKRQPFLNLLFSRIAFLLQPFALGTAMQGYADAVTGMAQSIPAGGSKTLVFYPCLPHGVLWMFPELKGKFGFGPAQAATIRFKLKRASSVDFGDAELSIAGNMMVRVQPHEVSARGQRRTYVPEFREETIRGYKHTFPDALPLFALETTAEHDASGLGRLKTRIDAEPIHEDAELEDIIAELLNVPNFPAEADISGQGAVIHAVTNEKPFRELVPGKLTIEQSDKAQEDMALAFYGFPVVDLEERGLDTKKATQIREKSILSVSTAATEFKDYPQKLTAFLPDLEVDKDDREYHELGGVGVALGGEPELYIPPAFSARVEAAAKMAPSAEVRESVAKHAARVIPGAAVGGRGINASSPIMARMKAIAGA